MALHVAMPDGREQRLVCDPVRLAMLLDYLTHPFAEKDDDVWLPFDYQAFEVTLALRPIGPSPQPPSINAVLPPLVRRAGLATSWDEYTKKCSSTFPRFLLVEVVDQLSQTQLARLRVRSWLTGLAFSLFTFFGYDVTEAPSPIAASGDSDAAMSVRSWQPLIFEQKLFDWLQVVADHEDGTSTSFNQIQSLQGLMATLSPLRRGSVVEWTNVMNAFWTVGPLHPLPPHLATPRTSAKATDASSPNSPLPITINQRL